MTEPRDPGFSDRTPRDPYETLKQVLEDETLQGYIRKKGPLLERELPDELRYSEALYTFTVDENWGWPSPRNTRNMRPFLPQRFPDSQDFWVNVFRHGGEKGMNNFLNWMQAKPIESLAEAATPNDQYGLNPALHRAHIVAQPLMEGIRTALITVRADESNPHELDELGKLMMAGIEHPELAEAAFAAYKLLGRLMTSEDDGIMADKMGYDSLNRPRIVSAHDKLRE
jgi:hypothetical protein